jgi:hypothetical protein
MRVSIWQQFSSNHSAHFTVVGTFFSAAEANTAAEKIRAILRELEAWWDALTPEEQLHWDNQLEAGRPTPIEQEIGNRFQVEWPNGINWFSYQTWDHNQLPVHVHEESVFVRTPHLYDWYCPKPFDQLLQIFGAQVAMKTEACVKFPDTRLLADINFQAADEKKADWLQKVFTADFSVPPGALPNYPRGILTGLPLDFELFDNSYRKPPYHLFKVEREQMQFCLMGLDFSTTLELEWDSFQGVLVFDHRGI